MCDVLFRFNVSPCKKTKTNKKTHSWWFNSYWRELHFSLRVWIHFVSGSHFLTKASFTRVPRIPPGVCSMAKKSKPRAQRKGDPLKAKTKPVKIRKPWDETGTTWREGSRYPQPNSSVMSEWGRGRPASRTASILRRHPPRGARSVRVKRSERLRHGITSCVRLTPRNVQKLLEKRLARHVPAVL